MTPPVHFLVIGAQKCGTTTLFEDLRAHPDIHVAEKESSVLTGGYLSEDDLRIAYREAFRRSPTSGIRGEVSTTYTLLPGNPEVVANAATIPDVRAIYIVRDPIRRTISHHHHDYTLGLVGPDIDMAVFDRPELVNHSKYAMQIQPWLEALTPERVHVVRFEDYMSNRASGARKLFRFLGADPEPGAPDDIAHNAADTKAVATGWWRHVADNRIYRGAIRPLISERMRARIRYAVLPSTPPRPAGPSAATLEHLVNELSGEVDALATMLGTEQWWDLTATSTSLLSSEDPT